MKVSVVVPTCKNAPILTRCLSSVFDQAFKDYETIVVDCEYDEKVHEFCNSRTHVTYTVQEGKGLNDARNKGLQVSEGEIVLLIDDDTVLPQSFLRDVYSVFQKNIDAAGFRDIPLPDNTYQSKCNRYVENFSRKFLVKSEFAKIKGAAMAFRKKWDIKFDSQRKYYDADDTEFVYRFYKEGAQLQYFTYPYLYHEARSLKSVLHISVSMKAIQNLDVPGLLRPHNIVQTFLVLLFGVFFIFCDMKLVLLVLGGLTIFFLSSIISFTEAGSLYYSFGIFLHVFLNLLYTPLMLLLYMIFKVKKYITNITDTVEGA